MLIKELLALNEAKYMSENELPKLPKMFGNATFNKSTALLNVFYREAVTGHNAEWFLMPKTPLPRIGGYVFDPKMNHVENFSKSGTRIPVTSKHGFGQSADSLDQAIKIVERDVSDKQKGIYPDNSKV